jgi:tetratricopeptide (TPR) repeat protein
VHAAFGPDDAEKLERLGKKHYKAGRFEDAAAAFEAAFEAAEEPRLLYNLGRAEERLGRYPAAVRHVRQYLEDAADLEDREEVQTLLNVLEVKLRKAHGPVEIRSDPPGALVQLRSPDHDADGQTPYSDWLPFGRYELSVLETEFAPAKRTIQVGPGDPVSIDIALAPSTTAAMAATGAEPASAERSGGPGWGTWTTLGAGAALLVAGSVFAMMSKDSVDSRDKLINASREPEAPAGDGAAVVGHNDDAESRALIANISLIGGGAALLAGGLMLGGVF